MPTHNDFLSGMGLSQAPRSVSSEPRFCLRNGLEVPSVASVGAAAAQAEASITHRVQLVKQKGVERVDARIINKRHLFTFPAYLSSWDDAWIRSTQTPSHPKILRNIALATMTEFQRRTDWLVHGIGVLSTTTLPLIHVYATPHIPVRLAFTMTGRAGRLRIASGHCIALPQCHALISYCPRAVAIRRLRQMELASGLSAQSLADEDECRSVAQHQLEPKALGPMLKNWVRQHLHADELEWGFRFPSCPNLPLSLLAASALDTAARREHENTCEAASARAYMLRAKEVRRGYGDSLLDEELHTADALAARITTLPGSRCPMPRRKPKPQQAVS